MPAGADATSLGPRSTTDSTLGTVVVGSSGDSLVAADPMTAVMARTDVSEAPVTKTFAATAGRAR